MDEEVLRNLRTILLLTDVMSSEPPLPELPPPAERIALRERWGISRDLMAALLGVAPNTLLAAELGRYAEMRALERNHKYARLLGWLSRLTVVVPENEKAAA